MRKILVIGIGAGNPDYMTIQAINALNAADVFFVLDKGEAAEELIAIREEICRRFITRANYRVVKVAQPERDRASADYKAGVDAWHADKAALFETADRPRARRERMRCLSGLGRPGTLRQHHPHPCSEILAREPDGLRV